MLNDTTGLSKIYVLEKLVYTSNLLLSAKFIAPVLLLWGYWTVCTYLYKKYIILRYIDIRKNVYLIGVIIFPHWILIFKGKYVTYQVGCTNYKSSYAIYVM